MIHTCVSRCVHWQKTILIWVAEEELSSTYIEDKFVVMLWPPFFKVFPRKNALHTCIYYENCSDYTSDSLFEWKLHFYFEWNLCLLCMVLTNYFSTRRDLATRKQDENDLLISFGTESESVDSVAEARAVPGRVLCRKVPQWGVLSPLVAGGVGVVVVAWEISKKYNKEKDQLWREESLEALNMCSDWLNGMNWVLEEQARGWSREESLNLTQLHHWTTENILSYLNTTEGAPVWPGII